MITGNAPTIDSIFKIPTRDRWLSFNRVFNSSPAATAEIAGMIEKLSISRSSNAEESDASSEDGGSDATRTVQSVERVQYNKSISTESSSSTVSNVSWTNEDRDQERELRSRSSSECSNSSSASSDSTPPKCDEENKDLEIRFDNLKIVQADDSQQKVAEISERDVDSNCERTTDDSDDESSAEENQESDDTESESDGEEFTQRGPMTSDSRRSPPYRSRPYDDTRNQNRNNIRQDIGDYYSQEPYNVPDSSVGVSTTGNDEVSQQVSNVMLDACLRTITADPKAALQICQLMEAADFEPDTVGTNSAGNRPLRSKFSIILPGMNEIRMFLSDDIGCYLYHSRT